MKCFIAGIILLAGMGARADGPNAAIIHHLAYDVITQTYLDMAASGNDMQAKIDALKTARTQANLEAAQESWRQMRSSWETSEAFLFGPVESLGVDQNIDQWPLNHLDLDAVLASGRALTPEFVRSLPVNLQGYHVLEYLLFGTGDVSNHKDVADLSPRQVEYLSATSTVLTDYANKLARAWTTNSNPDDPATPGFAQILATPSLDNVAYPSEQAAMSELVKGMMGILEEVGTGKLSDPLGPDAGHANPAAVESPNSWNSLTDFTNNIRSVLNIYTGSYKNAGGPGIRDAVAAVDPALAAQVEQRLVQAMANIQAIAGQQKLDFRQAITVADGRARTAVAIADLADLRALVESRVLPIVEQ